MKGFFKKLTAMTALGVFGLTGVLPATAATNTAVFNSLPGRDYPNMQITKAGQAFSNATSTTAQVGDTVNLLVWAHNSNPVGGPVAKNVKVKVTVPTSTSTGHTFSSTLSADNAQTVTGTSSVSVGANSQVSYIPGSAKLYKNVNNQLTETAFPTGVSADQVVTTGINLGDQQACWEYARAVLIQVRITGTSVDLATEKKVALSGGAAFSDSTAARPGDAVSFKIFLQNTGNATGIEPHIIDTLDERLSYLPGTSYVRVKRNNQDVDIMVNNPQTSGAGGRTLTWAFTDMAPQPDSALYLIFQARVADASKFTANETTINNCAKAGFKNGSSFKTTNCVTIKITKASEMSFSLSKEVRNIGNNADSQWYESVGATTGSKVSFRLQLINTGNATAGSVTLKDILPAGLTYAGNMKLYNTANPNGVAINGDDIVKNGYIFTNLGTGTPNTQTITFDATVASACNQSYLNKAQVIFSGAVKAQDDASVTVTCTAGLNIIKDILESTSGEFRDNAGNVFAGHTLTYRIRVFNSGTSTVVRPMLSDVLPSNVTFIGGTLTIDGQAVPVVNENEFFNRSAGMMLTDFTPGMSKDIIFKVKVGVCPPGSVTLTNTAYIHANGVIEISDTATATLAACNVPTPTPTPPTTPPTHKPTPPVSLPKTGPEAAVALMGGISGIGATVGRYYNLKKKLKNSAQNIEIL
ncbi:MAG: hypothetical protein K0S20_488 [Patescibacteria group bacterium]|jgi:uncharacterized repeat protein (TIGR01451 family)|nr:hypothetical protein [Patescibacteria group bacterium]